MTKLHVMMPSIHNHAAPHTKEAPMSQEPTGAQPAQILRFVIPSPSPHGPQTPVGEGHAPVGMRLIAR